MLSHGTPKKAAEKPLCTTACPIAICLGSKANCNKAAILCRPCKRAHHQALQKGFYSGLVKGLSFSMSKWKRKKYELQEPSKPQEEEFSGVGLALLEQFAAGMSAPWQHLGA